MSDIDLTLDIGQPDVEENNETIPIKSEPVSKSRSKSVSKSSRSSKSSKSPKKNENISIAHLNVLANHDKLYKEATEAPKEVRNDSSSEENHRSRSGSKSRSRSSKSKHDNGRDKQIEYENNIQDLFNEKSEFVYKLEKLGFSRYSVEKYLLIELETEFRRRLKDLENKNGVSWCKKGLLYTVQGIELANTHFGPEAVDLEGWNQSLEYSMEVDKNWDAVLEELYEKYSMSHKLSPELRLLFMLVMSGVSFAGMKKINKHKESLSALFEGFVPKKQPPHQSTQHQQHSRHPQEEYESDSDNESRIPEPKMDINLEQIMEQMKKFKEKQDKEIVVNIPMAKKGSIRGRGRGKSGISRQVILE
jgi:hypothetical protein